MTVSVSLNAIDVLSSLFGFQTGPQAAFIALLTTRLHGGVTTGQADIVLLKRQRASIIHRKERTILEHELLHTAVWAEQLFDALPSRKQDVASLTQSMVEMGETS